VITLLKQLMIYPSFFFFFHSSNIRTGGKQVNEVVLNVKRVKGDDLPILVSAAAGNKSTTRPPLPLSGCGGDWKGTGRKLVGRDKGSLTEQQTKGTATTMIQIRRKRDKTDGTTDPLSWTAPPLSPPEPQVSSRRATPPAGTPHDGTWYGIPSSVWPAWGWVSPPSCAPSWILAKINPVLAKPRTLSTRYSIPSTSCPGPPLSS